MDLVDYSEHALQRDSRRVCRTRAPAGSRRRALRAGVGAEGRQHRDARANACRGTRASRCSTCSKRCRSTQPTDQALRFPVQWVARQDGSQADDFRGYMGRVEAGEVKLGDTIIVLPANREATVAEIIAPVPGGVGAGGSRVRRSDGDDPSRGRRRCVARRHVRAARQRAPEPAKKLEADLCWFDEEPLSHAAQVPAEADHEHGVRADRCDQGSARRAYAVAGRRSPRTRDERHRPRRVDVAKAARRAMRTTRIRARARSC